MSPHRGLPGHRVAGGLLALVSVGVGRGVLPAQSATEKSAPAAVSYVEQRERGDRRAFGSDPAQLYGIDINSRMAIQVDPARLRGLLVAADGAAPGQVQALSARIESLARGAASLEEVARLSASLPALYRRTGSPEANSAFRRQLQERSRTLLATYEALESAASARFQRSGIAVDSARVLAELRADSSLVKGGYDWNRLADLLAAEIARAKAEMDSLRGGEELALGIRALRTNPAGKTVAIPLEGYNSEAPGAPTRYEKLQFSASPEEQALLAHFADLASANNAAQDAGSAVMAALRINYLENRAPLQTVLAAADAAVRQEAGRLQALRAWGDSSRMQTFVQGLTLTPALRQPVAAADSLVGEIAADLAALQGLASLRGQLDGKDPVAALSILLSQLQASTPTSDGSSLVRAFDAAVWTQRAERARAVLASLQAGGSGPLQQKLLASDGPFGALHAAAAGLDSVSRSVQQASQGAVQWLRSAFLQAPASAPASLPRIAGEQHLPLSGDLSTAIDLTTIPGGRSIDDRIDVYYDVYRGGAEKSVYGWHDVFRVRSYGVNARVVAGLAFVVRQRESVWQPTPSLSWIARYQPWPHADGTDAGLGSSLLASFGLGLTTMSLAFDSQQAVEVGIAPTLSLLGGRVLGGPGINLQASRNKLFGFFSIRLFSVAGGLGGGG